MTVADIIDGVKEVTGSCSDTVLYSRITRAVQLLANEGLFDPLIGTLDFSIDGSYWLALPKEVKAPIRINIARNPSFVRNRLFEFTMNTDGSVEGEEIGFSFADRGYTPIQNQIALPGRINALCASVADNGKQIKVIGKDGDGMEREEMITMKNSNPDQGGIVFYSVESVLKDITENDVYLRVNDVAMARYQAAETQPNYRMIKLTKTGVACRMIYRKHVFKLENPTDIIPIDSEMAVIMAADSVQLYLNHEYEGAAAAMATAIDFVKKEQASRDQFTTEANNVQVTTATDNNITTRDSLIVADVYDEACAILGLLGRENVFDAITNAVEALANKGNWDSTIGTVDIWKPAHTDSVRPFGQGHGDGYFVLPRYVEAPLAINVTTGTQTQGIPHTGYARNRWYEFHLNGNGERSTSAYGTWDDIGEVYTNEMIPLDPESRKPIPQYFAAVCESPLDDGVSVIIFGTIRLADGSEQEKEYTIPCGLNVVSGPGTGAPQFIRINRIVKDVSVGFIRLFSIKQTSGVWGTDLQYGFYYPDEVEPKYRLIKVPNCREARIRMRFRRRLVKFSGLCEPIFLRSRLAIPAMLRAIETSKTDPDTAMKHEAMALQYLKDEQSANNGVAPFTLQFDRSVMPGVTENFM